MNVSACKEGDQEECSFFPINSLTNASKAQNHPQENKYLNCPLFWLLLAHERLHSISFEKKCYLKKGTPMISYFWNPIFIGLKMTSIYFNGDYKQGSSMQKPRV